MQLQPTGQGVHHRPVHVLDVEEADLLTHLTPTTDYIAAALHGDATPPSTARARAGHPSACTPGVPASACASAAPGAGGATPNRVLVHCIQGKSRSATVVAAYLMRYLGYTRADAVQAMVQRRPIVDPNPGFLKQVGWVGPCPLVAAAHARSSSRTLQQPSHVHTMKLLRLQACWVVVRCVSSPLPAVAESLGVSRCVGLPNLCTLV